jgi:hypothetical protein
LQKIVRDRLPERAGFVAGPEQSHRARRKHFTQITDGHERLAVPLNRDVQVTGDQDPRFFMSVSQKF